MAHPQRDPESLAEVARAREQAGARVPAPAGDGGLPPREHLACAQQGEAVGNNPVAVGRYLQHRLRGQAREIFMALFLDNRHRLIACEELFQGTINAAPVYPREVVRRALLHNAAAVILSHNHPSGDPEPSGADTRITDELQQALALVDVRLLDYTEHTLSASANAQAASYVELAVGDRVLWGAGMDSNTTRASLKAVISGVNRAVRDAQEAAQD